MQAWCCLYFDANSAPLRGAAWEGELVMHSGLHLNLPLMNKDFKEPITGRVGKGMVEEETWLVDRSMEAKM